VTVDVPTKQEAQTAAARVGLASQGFLYIVVALLALTIVFGDDAQADQHGAIDAVAAQPFGKLLLLMLTAGVASHAVWRASKAIRSDDDEPAKRLADSARAVLYGGFTFVCIHTLLDAGGGSGSGAGGGSNERKATGTVLDWPGGRTLVVIAGLVVIGAGVWQWRQPFTQRFIEKLRVSQLSDGWRRAVIVLGTIGFIARGIALAIIGWFLVQAAMDNAPDEAGGLDQALHSLATDKPWRLVAVAAGLAAFGLFRIVDGALRRVSET
jgi:multisubunit Na+/H+ antiporter MnhG subunit